MTTETMTPIRVVPYAVTYDLLLTLTTPLSHHDAAVQDDSNRTLFNRQKQLLDIDAPKALPDALQTARILADNPVPADISPLFSDLSLAEFVAVACVRQFIDIYNSLDGTGLFSGMERYARLEARLNQAAIVAPTLKTWWSKLCQDMQVEIHSGKEDADLLRLLSVPAGLQGLVLRVMSDQYRAVVALARYWHSQRKLANEEYAAAVGREDTTSDLVVLNLPVPAPLAEGNAAVLEVPTISANSLRHQVVREPAWLHLRRALGLVEAEPGKGPLPPGAESLFYNGGNISAGSKQPPNAFVLGRRARALYPTLDLLGGVTDSFDLGESRLRVAGWLVCKENAEAIGAHIAAQLPAAQVSVFDMLDDVTLTRQAGETEQGQMIYSFETLCPGTQILCRLTLAAGTAELTRGALLAALDTYLAEDATIGGQAARGFGHLRGELWGNLLITDDAARKAYEAYLSENRAALLDGLTSGDLGTGARILS